jgi:hypothetical protein
MTSHIHISHGGDFYEVHIREWKIVRVTKYCGSSQFQRETSFEELNPVVQELIIDKIYER